MPTIRLLTLIDAPVGRVFDLARSIDAHVASTDGTAERAVAEVTSGLIEAGQSVTWEARHFGLKQRLTVRITRMHRPEFFEDEMVSGAFKRMHHRHEFVFRSGRTEMTDVFDFAAPFGILGRAVESCFLRAYVEQFLRLRATKLKRMAESDEWRKFVADA